ncbi:MAG TPA: hypothetical protein VK359_06685, partial [Rubrobacteraceae bacterium]|nr:hypothetical protein [Rubrobacteraceae bacterium]
YRCQPVHQRYQQPTGVIRSHELPGRAQRGHFYTRRRLPNNKRVFAEYYGRDAISEAERGTFARQRERGAVTHNARRAAFARAVLAGTACPGDASARAISEGGDAYSGSDTPACH